MINEPYLSLQLRTFSPEQPDSWQPVIDLAIAADRAGVGRSLFLITSLLEISLKPTVIQASVGSPEVSNQQVLMGIGLNR